MLPEIDFEKKNKSIALPKYQKTIAMEPLTATLKLTKRQPTYFLIADV